MLYFYSVWLFKLSLFYFFIFHKYILYFFMLYSHDKKGHEGDQFLPTKCFIFLPDKNLQCNFLIQKWGLLTFQTVLESYCKNLWEKNHKKASKSLWEGAAFYILLFSLRRYTVNSISLGIYGLILSLIICVLRIYTVNDLKIESLEQIFFLQTFYTNMILISLFWYIYICTLVEGSPSIHLKSPGQHQKDRKLAGMLFPSL